MGIKLIELTTKGRTILFNTDNIVCLTTGCLLNNISGTTVHTTDAEAWAVTEGLEVVAQMIRDKE